MPVGISSAFSLYAASGDEERLAATDDSSVPPLELNCDFAINPLRPNPIPHPW
jgi:hypothetical protein